MGIFSLADFKLVHSSKRAIPKALEKADQHFLEKFNDALTRENFTFGKVSNDELAGILYTSGTSGFSKGAMLPHNSLAANVRFARNNIALKAGDTILAFLPMAHTFGCTFDFLFPVCVGCHITFLGKMPTPKVLVQALGEIRPRLILSVPLLIEKIYKSRLKPKVEKTLVKSLSKLPVLGRQDHHKIRGKLVEVFGGNFIEIVIGGAALNAEVEAFLRKIDFPFTIGYGMTECGPLISYIPWPKNKSGAVGVSEQKTQQDFANFYKQITTLVETPDIDPDIYIDYSRIDPYSKDISAPYRLDCALTYKTTSQVGKNVAPVDRVKRELTTDEWRTIQEKPGKQEFHILSSPEVNRLYVPIYLI